MELSSLLYLAQVELEKVSLPQSSINLMIEYVFKAPFNEIVVANTPVTSKLEKEFKDLLTEVIKKEKPLAYIIGFEYFYGEKIYVNSDCLIPRIESEELVYATIKFIKENYKKGIELDILDCCTGSGVIGLTLYKQLKNDYKINLSVTDLSRDALQICRKNMEENGIPYVEYIGNILEPIIKKNKKFDIVVTNPPYIASNEKIENMVVNNEPKMALFSGPTGYEIYELLIKQLNIVLKDEFFVGFEHADKQGKTITNLIKEKFHNVEIWTSNDLFGRERNTFFTNVRKNDYK